MTLKAEVSKYQEDLVRSVQELVQIKSVHEQPLPGKPFGDGVDKALGYVLSLAESMGFSTKIWMATAAMRSTARESFISACSPTWTSARKGRCGECLPMGE